MTDTANSESLINIAKEVCELMAQYQGFKISFASVGTYLTKGHALSSYFIEKYSVYRAPSAS